MRGGEEADCGYVFVILESLDNFVSWSAAVLRAIVTCQTQS